MVRYARGRRRALPTALLALAALATLAAPAASGPKRWTTVPGKSQVAFNASFALGDFAGSSEDVTGEFLADPADLRQGVAGVLRVNPATLRTGVGGRDVDMRRALAVVQYPEIRFTVERVEPSFPSVTDRSDVLLTISGLVLIHGVERPMVFPGRVRLRDDRLWVRGESRLKMRDFGIKPPKRFFLEVADSVGVSFDIVLGAEN
jgi:polyisoprenoid-binding protein YceI